MLMYFYMYTFFILILHFLFFPEFVYTCSMFLHVPTCSYVSIFVPSFFFERSPTFSYFLSNVLEFLYPTFSGKSEKVGEGREGGESRANWKGSRTNEENV